MNTPLTPHDLLDVLAAPYPGMGRLALDEGPGLALVLPGLWREESAEGESTVLTAAAEYELRHGPRVLKGWTLGQIHPNDALDVDLTPWEFKGAAGDSYAFVESLEDRVSGALLARAGRVWSRQLGGRWVIRHADRSREWLKAATGVSFDGLDLLADFGAVVDRLGGVVDCLSDGDDILDCLASPERHAPLRAAVEALVDRPRWPARIVALWGVGHLPGIERDVWTPLGFRLRSVRWSTTARIKPVEEVRLAAEPTGPVGGRHK